jgi:hypothetical protein
MDAAFVITMTMEAASTAETSVNLYQGTYRNNPEDSHLQTRRHENVTLTCHCFLIVSIYIQYLCTPFFRSLWLVLRPERVLRFLSLPSCTAFVQNACVWSFLETFNEVTEPQNRYSYALSSYSCDGPWNERTWGHELDLKHYIGGFWDSKLVLEISFLSYGPKVHYHRKSMSCFFPF